MKFIIELNADEVGSILESGDLKKLISVASKQENIREVIRSTEIPQKDEEVEEPVIETPIEAEAEMLSQKNEPEQEKTYTLEEVRAKLGDLSQNGKQQAAKNLITEAGAQRLSDIPPEKYAEIMKKAEAL